MIRYIPGRTRVKTEFMKNVTLGDIIVALIGFAGAIMMIASNLFGPNKLWFTVAWVSFIVSLYLPVDEGLRLYGSLGLLFRFAALKKKYIKSEEKKRGYAFMKEIIPFYGVKMDMGEYKFIDFGEYYGSVIQIEPLEFGLLEEEKQDMIIHTFSKGLRRIAQNQSASVVKVRKPMKFDKFMEYDDKKYAILNQLHADGQFTKDELDARAPIFEERVMTLDKANRDEPVLQDQFYMVIYGTDKQALEETTFGIVTDITNGQAGIHARRLFDKDIAVFLKANYEENFNEREVDGLSHAGFMDWVMPKKIEFKTARTIIDGKGYRQFVLTKYPLQVGNAWGYTFFSLTNAKVVMNFKPVPKEKAEKIIDRSIMEKKSRLSRGGKSSRVIEDQTHLETLQGLMNELKNNNEQLFDVNTHIMVKEVARKEVKAILRQNGYRVAEMFGRQVDAFISSNVSRLDNIRDFTRGMPTTTIAASFPFISSIMQDERGFYIGDNDYPVFIDFFRRDSERVNSNMMIIGKSGSGKSYATKVLLANLAADKTKMFILDPEEEYVPLAYNLGGKVIDVGSNKSGIINPFHIMTDLEDDSSLEQKEAKMGKANKVEKTNTLPIHLQFLEQFFQVVLEGIDSDAFETLNTLIVEVYRTKNIDSTTDLSKLKSTDYPIFEDLYALINEKLKTEKDPYFKRNLQALQIYIQKFSTGGRNSNLWNGYTSIETDENFVSFNFRTLFSNRNYRLANAQMLLIFKYLNNEIINNREFNLRFGINRQIVVAVDEAHMFIDPKFPVALDFMAEMAKRIRKYEGMQIIITQNIKDFLGSADIQRKSSAIINASQFSMIFQLAPNDINDLIELYKNSSGGINKDEQDGIVTAVRGVCFLISGPLSRTFLHIHALPTVQYMIGEKK